MTVDLSKSGDLLKVTVDGVIKYYSQDNIKVHDNPVTIRFGDPAIADPLTPDTFTISGVALSDFDSQIAALFSDVGAAAVDFGLQVSRGLVAGIESVHKFGEAHDGVQTTPTDIWDRADSTPTQQTWIAPTQARIHAIVSDSASDTLAGVGARTIHIHGLTDWDTKEVTELINMNGTDSVNTVNAYVIIHRIRVRTSGSTSINVGTIIATAATDATITAEMRPTEGSTHMCIYGVPSTQTFCMTQWGASINKSSGSSGDIDFRLCINREPDVQLIPFSVRSERGVHSDATSNTDWQFNPPLAFVGPCIIKIDGTGSANDLDGAAEFVGYLVDN